MHRHGPAQNGTLLVDTSVFVNVVTPYLTVRLTLSPSEMSISWPRTILGLIPVGREEVRLHPKSVRSIRLAPVVFWRRLALVPVLVALPVATKAPLPFAVVCLILAMVFLVLGVVAGIEVRHPAGRSTIAVCWLQRDISRRFIADVRGAMAEAQIEGSDD